MSRGLFYWAVHLHLHLERSDSRTGREGEVRDLSEALVVAEKVVLSDLELEVEHVEVLALDAADIAFAEDTRAERPVDILECGIVEVLERKRKRVRIHDPGWI